MNYVFNYDLGQYVKITALKQEGLIEGVRILGHISIQRLREEYFVTYWLEGKRESAWLYAVELEEV